MEQIGSIHAITPQSTVNGPGTRFVIHFQGCTLQCPGCFNPDTHSLSAGQQLTVSDIIKQIPPDISGVTISGGEPFLQPKFLLELVQQLRLSDYSIAIFSGFYLKEIEKMTLGLHILAQIDALIDGRFDETAMATMGLHGSNNQTIHLFTSRYTENDFSLRSTEIWIDAAGNIQITGFPTKNLLDQIK